MWGWCVAVGAAWAADRPVPPPSRLEGVAGGVGLETLIGGPVIGGRIDVNAFRRGWTYGVTLDLGADPAPGMFLIDGFGMGAFGGAQLGLGQPVGASRAVLTPYVGGIRYSWLGAGFSSWGPLAGAFLDFWEPPRERGQPIQAAGVRFGAELRMLPVMVEGAMAFAPQGSLTLSLGALSANRITGDREPPGEDGGRAIPAGR